MDVPRHPCPPMSPCSGPTQSNYIHFATDNVFNILFNSYNYSYFLCLSWWLCLHSDRSWSIMFLFLFSISLLSFIKQTPPAFWRIDTRYEIQVPRSCPNGKALNRWAIHIIISKKYILIAGPHFWLDDQELSDLIEAPQRDLLAALPLPERQWVPKEMIYVQCKSSNDSRWST